MPEKYKNLAVILTIFALIPISILLIKTSDRRKIREQLESPFGSMLNAPKMKIPVLMYHYVEYNKDERDFLRDSQNVPPNVFENQITTLKSAGYTFVTPKEIPDLLKNVSIQNKKYVVISFDDGFRDFYTDAFLILKKHNVRAINYIVYNFIGGQDYMTSEQIGKIAKSGIIEIGSHTLEHAQLTTNNEENVLYTLTESKKNLERDFGVKVESFAYPYGSHNKWAEKLVQRAGYTTAVTVESGNIVSESNLYSINRYKPGHLTGQDLISYIEK